MALHFLARDAGGEVVDVFDAYFLVSGEGGFGCEIGEGTVALVDPLGGLGVADAVDLEEELESGVGIVEGRVLETAEAVCEYDFFDFGGEAFSDRGDGKGSFFRCDLAALLLERRYSFAIGNSYSTVSVCSPNASKGRRG